MNKIYDALLKTGSARAVERYCAILYTLPSLAEGLFHYLVHARQLLSFIYYYIIYIRYINIRYFIIRRYG